jgi:peptide/nickel transport system substrate-binding protein
VTNARKALLVLALIGLGALLAQVWRADQRGAPAVARGGSLTATVRVEPVTFNRYAAADRTSELIAQLTQARLARINRQTQELEPWLAEGWTRSDDGLVYTLSLREGVRFSDGEPFTSADVLFAFEAVYDERVGSSIGQFLAIRGKRLRVTAPDPLTVVISFPSVWGPGLRLLDSLPILPRHRLEPALRDGTLRQAWGLATPPADIAGLGPFVTTEYVSGQRLVLERNPHYWRTAADGTRLPYLDRLTILIVPDQDAELLRLESGLTDLLQSEIRPEDYSALRRAAEAGRLQLVDLGPRMEADFLWLNLRPGAKAGDPREAWLQSRELRLAISHAVDREAFVNTVFLGAAVPVFGPVSPANRQWFAPDLPVQPYAPGRARELLAGIGLRDRTGDGWLEDEAGRPARFSLLTHRGNTARERSASVLQQYLGQIGLRVDVVELEMGALIAQFSGGDYDAVYFGFDTSDTDPSSNREFWLSSGLFHLWNPRQSRPATEWERRIDELMEQQAATDDQAERRRLFVEVQRIYAEQVPALCFAAPRAVVAMSARVENATPAVFLPQVLWNADILAARPVRRGAAAAGREASP